MTQIPILLSILVLTWPGLVLRHSEGNACTESIETLVHGTESPTFLCMQLAAAFVFAEISYRIVFHHFDTTTLAEPCSYLISLS